MTAGVEHGFLNARYYDGPKGRFLSQDPLFLALGDNGRIKEQSSRDLQQILSDPQLLHSYSYGRNNPLRYFDPDGQTPQEAAWGYAVGIGQGAFSTVRLGYNAVFHPINTTAAFARAVGNTAVDSFGLASDLIHNPSGTLSEIKEGIGIGVSQFTSQSDYEIGKDIGRVTEGVMEAVVAGRAASNISRDGIQVGNYNVRIDDYRRGGGGLNLRDTTLSAKASEQRIISFDIHRIDVGGRSFVLPHIDIGVGKDAIKHLPWNLFK